MITDRILKIIQLNNENKHQFYKKTGLSNGFLDKVKDVGASKIEYILKSYPEINPEWLLTGDGPMLKSSNRDIFRRSDEEIKKEDLKSKVKEPLEPYVNEKIEYKSIPLVSTTAIVGLNNSVFSVEQKDVKEHYIIPKFQNKNIDFMIEVEESSMYPKYNSGDILACRIINHQSFIQWNKTHVIATKHQGIIIKRINPGADGLMMVSENEEYPPFEVPKNQIDGIALVVGVIRLE